jgi:hypothetical protein
MWRRPESVGQVPGGDRRIEQGDGPGSPLGSDDGRLVIDPLTRH